MCCLLRWLASWHAQRAQQCELRNHVEHGSGGNASHHSAPRRAHMETSLRFNSTHKRLKIHVKERFHHGDGYTFTLYGSLDTTTGTLSGTGVARKSYALKNALLTRVDLSTTCTSDGGVTYGVAGRSRVDLSDDGLLGVEARLGVSLPSSAFAAAWGRRHSSGSYATVSGARAAKRAQASGRSGGRSDDGGLDVSSVAKSLGKALVPEGTVAVTQVLLGFNGKQDIKLSVGYDIASKQPFLAVKENAWAARAELSGKFELAYNL